MAMTKGRSFSFFGIVLFLLFINCVGAAENHGNEYSIVDMHQTSTFSQLHFQQHHRRVERAVGATSPSQQSVLSTSSGVADTASSNVTDTSTADTVSSVNTNTILPEATTQGLPSINADSTVPTNATTVSITETTTVEDPFKEADLIHDHHLYYNTSAEKEKVESYYVDLTKGSRHEILSSTHRVAAVINLKFKFPFYGHPITNVTVATGGFMYMSPFLHQWLTATQYIAPLMANFDPSLSAGSHIYYLSEAERFTVEWREVLLKDQQDYGNFTFQASLHLDGRISFAYKQIPVDVNKISVDNHPVKIGLSDAYYNDTYLPQWGIRRRTIYEYHQVKLRKSFAKTGAVIHVDPLPTCNTLADCDSCARHSGVAFDCMWCNTIGRCSDGLDWFRQHWDNYGCKSVSTNQTKDCAKLPPPINPIINPIPQLNGKKECSGGNCNKGANVPVAVVVVVILVLLSLVAGVGGWTYYAYTHPTSRSGMWLMEHRPSQIKAKIKFWKNSSNSDSAAKYRAESDA